MCLQMPMSMCSTPVHIHTCACVCVHVCYSVPCIMLFSSVHHMFVMKVTVLLVIVHHHHHHGMSLLKNSTEHIDLPLCLPSVITVGK